MRRCGKRGWHNANRPVRHSVGATAELDRLKGNSMISWLIGIVTGMIYDFIGIAAGLKPEDEARRLKARWALSLGVWNSGDAG